MRASILTLVVVLGLSVLCVASMDYDNLFSHIDERRTEVPFVDEDGDTMPSDSYDRSSSIAARWPVRPVRPVIFTRTLSTRNLTNLYMHALETNNLLVMMVLNDHETLIAYPTDLPFGGLYKGLRGLLMLGERCKKVMRILKSSYEIIHVDEERGTAKVVVTQSAVVRRTKQPVAIRKIVLLQFALNRLKCMDIVDNDYPKIKDAVSTRAEKALTVLGNAVFENGISSRKTLDLVADNITVTLSSACPRTLFKADKNLLAQHDRLSSKEYSDGHKLLHYLKDNTKQSLVVYADDCRVVLLNMAGDVYRAKKMFARHAEGLVWPQMSRIDELAVYFTLYEFDTNGKLHRANVHLNRPLTLRDRFYLRHAHNINIKAGSTA